MYFSVLQTMIDWDWLWVAGELAVSYGFYSWWKADDKFLAVLAVHTAF